MIGYKKSSMIQQKYYVLSWVLKTENATYSLVSKILQLKIIHYSTTKICKVHSNIWA